MNIFRSRAAAAAATSVLGVTMLAILAPAMTASTAIAQGVGQASYAGVTFSYDTSLATDVRGQIVPSNVGQGVLVSEIRPEHVSFSFDGYPSNGVWTPRIRVIPLDAYKSAQAQSGVGGALNSLGAFVGSDLHGTLPLLPPVNAERVISEDVKAVAGTGVSGVRFIASYAQAIIPVSADNITYMFTGLTSDHKYYVEGTFPVALSTPLAPAPSPVTVENAQTYNQAVAERLRNTDASGFVPTLDKLDNMMGSVQVNASVIPGMPATGAGTGPDQGVVSVALALAIALIASGLATSTRHKARR